MGFFQRRTKRELVADLEERLAKTEKRLDQVEMEWNEWFDKFRRLYARIAKRARDLEQAESVPTPRSPGDGRSPIGTGRITNPAAIALLMGHRGPGGGS